MDGLNGGLSVDQDRGGPDESRTERRRSYSIGYSPVLPEAQAATRLIYALRVASRAFGSVLPILRPLGDVRGGPSKS